MVMTGPGHVVTGWADLHWRGARWFTGTDASGTEIPVEIFIGTRDLRRRPGLFFSAEAIGSDHREVVDGVPVADVLSAVAYLMRYAPSVREAARIASVAAYDDLVSIEELTRFVTPGQNSYTGVPQARDALGYATENCWSPAEFDLSWVWVAHGGRLPPSCNTPLFDLSGQHIATPDVVDPVAGVAGEYEGMVHLERSVRAGDVRREALLRSHGVEVVTMTADDRHDSGSFLRRLAEAYARAELRPRSDRSWTAEPPSWWVPTVTVEQRRALTPSQRSRFLRYRAS